MKPRPGFRAKFRGRDLWKERVPRSGVTYSPLAHWSLAAIWAGYKQENFFDLPGEKQSWIVALFDLKNQIEGVIAGESSRKGRSGK